MDTLAIVAVVVYLIDGFLFYLDIRRTEGVPQGWDNLVLSLLLGGFTAAVLICGALLVLIGYATYTGVHNLPAGLRWLDANV